MPRTPTRPCPRATREAVHHHQRHPQAPLHTGPRATTLLKPPEPNSFFSLEATRREALAAGYGTNPSLHVYEFLLLALCLFRAGVPSVCSVGRYGVLLVSAWRQHCQHSTFHTNTKRRAFLQIHGLFGQTQDVSQIPGNLRPASLAASCFVFLFILELTSCFTRQYYSSSSTTVASFLSWHQRTLPPLPASYVS